MKIIKLLAIFLSVGLVSACQSTWYEGEDFGSSVTEAVASQTANPSAPGSNKKPTKGLDGPSAKAGVDNYQRSYENKTSTGSYAGGGVLTPSSGGSGMNTIGTSTK